MSVTVHYVHNNIVPHLATPCCLFGYDVRPWLTMLSLAWLSRTFTASRNMRLPPLLVPLVIHLHPIHPMPPTVNKNKQNIWRVACALYHALCKVRGPRVLCCHVCRAHARPCLSTGWALDRRFDLTFRTAAVLVQGGGDTGGQPCGCCISHC